MSVPNNFRKAAILVNSLDTAAADRVLEQMGSEQARLVRQAIMDLDTIDPEEEQTVLEEFARLGALRPPQAAAGVALERPPHPRTIRVDGPEPAGIPFHFLRHARGEKITPLLTGEHPQTIALVVSHLPAEQAVEVLSQLNGAIQANVLHRLANLDEAHPDVVREVERGLHRRIGELSRAEQRRLMGAATLRKILDAAPGPVRRQLLENLAGEDSQLAAELTPPTHALDFDELRTFSDAAWRTLLRHCERDWIVLALADAPAPLVDRVVQLLPAADGRQLRHALSHLGPTRLSDVAGAQQELCRIAERLAADGLIDLPQTSLPLAA